MQSLSKYQWHFHKTRTNNPKICIEPQKTQNSQSRKKEERNWRYHAPRFETILQYHSNQNSMVLAQGQAQRSMEQNRESRNKSTLIWSINLQQRRQEYTMIKRQPL